MGCAKLYRFFFSYVDENIEKSEKGKNDILVEHRQSES